MLNRYASTRLQGRAVALRPATAVLIAHLGLLAACAEDKPGETGDPGVDGPFAMSGDEHLPLPFVTAGDDAPEATFTLTATGARGSDSDVSALVLGPFELEGETTPLGAGEARRYIVRYTGDTSEPSVGTGSVHFEADDQLVEVSLAAVVGDPALPDADWETDSWGTQATLGLPSAPFPYEDSPYDDASVLIFVPDGLADRGALGVVTHLHGHNATLADIVASQHLVEQHALSGRDAVLIVPQGPVEAEDGDFGRLAEPDGLATLVRDVVAVLYRDGVVTHPETGAVALTAHSGGYRATAAMVRSGGLPVTAVHLFDALYGDTDTFADFAEDGGTLRSSYTASGGTDLENESLRDDLGDVGVTVGESFTDADLQTGPITVGPVDATHAGCVTDERAYARWLAESGLAHRPSAPPELLSVLSDGDSAVVTWRADGGGEPLRYKVEGSDDNSRWSLLTDTGETTASVPATAWVRVRTTDVRFGDSEPSDTYGGTGADWLVVDGFDRVLDGSYTAPTHTFAATVGAALGAYSVASNEAVASGAVRLADFPRVVWLLGDEGLADRTFDPAERAAVAAYVEAGGTLVVSGAEVAYATDPTWLADVLHAAFVSDNAGTGTVETWIVGAAYPEDYPDVLVGDTTLWSWETGGAAAVGWDQRVVVVGFGLENLSRAHLASAVASLEDWLD
ncbi:MAG: fibronectin type III domain-containing protein [Pseudomonadota bacterium]|nr:fibronectin type III domain-containing protein [Pseudomonadota bacterium]